MKILMVVDAAPPLYGGAGQQAELLAAELRSDGFEVEIYARQKRRVRTSPPGTRFAKPYVKNSSISSILFAAATFIRILRVRPDVIHVHGAYYYGLSAAMAGRILRRPMILKVALVGSDDPSTVARSRWLGMPIGRLVAWQFASAAVIVALSSEVAESIRSYNPTLGVIIQQNGAAAPPPRHPILRDVRGDGSPAVTFLGVLSRRKGIDVLLKAWTRILEQLPEGVLTLAGPLPSDDPAIGLLLREHHPNVVWLGPVEHGTARALLSDTDVYVLPSHAEGMPNALIEALVAGVACVVSDIPVIRATADSAAIFVQPGDDAGLAQAVVRAYREQKELGERALRVGSGYAISTVAQRYADLYRNLRRLDQV